MSCVSSAACGAGEHHRAVMEGTGGWLWAHSWGSGGARHAGMDRSAWGGRSSHAQACFRSLGTGAVFPHGHEVLTWTGAGPSWMFPGLRATLRTMSLVQVNKSQSRGGRHRGQTPSQAGGSCGQLGKHTMNPREDSGPLPRLRLSPSLSVPPALQPPDPHPRAGEHSAPSVLDMGM